MKQKISWQTKRTGTAGLAILLVAAFVLAACQKTPVPLPDGSSDGAGATTTSVQTDDATTDGTTTDGTGSAPTGDGTPLPTGQGTTASTSGGAAASTTGGSTGTTTTATPSTVTCDFRKPGDTNTFGVWWWKIGTVKTAQGDTYLNFLAENKISEIYLCIDGLSENGNVSFSDVRAFVKKAKAKGMRVAALTGDYKWIEPTNTGFEGYVNKYNAYQKAAAADEKFYSMHLDVEPHQHPDFKTGTAGRAKIMQWFADFAVNKAAPAAKAAGTLLEWDIPFWMTDTVNAQGGSIVLAELMAKICDTITIMSYRDTAAAMLDVSKEEIAFAKKHGCKIVLGAETYSKEGDAVSFMEEGKAYMAKELTSLNSRLLTELPDRNFGLAVHQNERWYALKD